MKDYRILPVAMFTHHVVSKTFDGKTYECDEFHYRPKLMPKGCEVCDYSLDERIAELEYSDTGQRQWVHFNMLFPMRMLSVDALKIDHKMSFSQEMLLDSIKVDYKRKRQYISLVFIPELPF